MSMMSTGLGADRPDLPEAARFRRYAPHLAAELRAGEEPGHPARVTEISAAGARVEVAADIADRALSAEVVVVIPSLGQYKARRGWREGAEAAYLFTLGDHSMRALDALMRDRFHI